MLTDKFNVYRSEWLDLVFANRNHEYGAYDLRRNYSRTLNKALVVATVMFTSAVYFPMIYQKMKAGDQSLVVKPTDGGTTVVLDMRKIKQASLPPAAPKTDPVAVKTTRFVAPRVVHANEVTEEMPEITTLERSVISTKSQEGIEVPSNVSPAVTNATEGTGAQSEGVNTNEPLSLGIVETFPQFPGGMEAFASFLRKNLRYPAVASENGISGRVFLSFIVERDGSLTDIKVIKGIGFGCDEEAIRVLKKSPSWSPGIQNKQKVRVQYTLPLLFQFSD